LSSISGADLKQARKAVTEIVVESGVKAYIAQIVRKTREWPTITLGASPRAGIAVFRVAKALAAIDARDFVVPDDVKASVKCTLRHRIILNPEAELEGLRADEALDQVLRSVEVPK
jgi:MoxR-like ATPase